MSCRRRVSLPPTCGLVAVTVLFYFENKPLKVYQTAVKVAGRTPNEPLINNLTEVEATRPLHSVDSISKRS